MTSCRHAFESSATSFAKNWQTTDLQHNYTSWQWRMRRIDTVSCVQVGIHFRAAREKISHVGNVSGHAHIMNDEATRKYLQVTGGAHSAASCSVSHCNGLSYCITPHQ